MKFSAIQILNYKGFHDSGSIALHPHVNVLVGQNSAGKSSVLEALHFGESLQNFPHRDPTQPFQAGRSVCTADICVKGADILDYSLRTSTDVHLKMPDGVQSPDAYLKMFRTGMLNFKATRRATKTGIAVTEMIVAGRTLPTDHRTSVTFSPDPVARTHRAAQTGTQNNIGDIFQGAVSSQIFSFRAERFRVGRCSLQMSRTLAADASNLPVCLAYLNRNTQEFSEYVQLVREVLPQIHSVTVGPDSATNSEIEVLIYNTHSRSEGMGIPLNDCGTGVAQALAILFVVLKYQDAVVLIDEPNTFLHPAAAKSLMRILRRQRNLQFIVSTHSSEVISTLAPERVLDVRWNTELGRSEVASLDAAALTTKRAVLANLGVTFADLFGAELLVWTEGATEAGAFELLLDASDVSRPPGLKFLAMPFASKVDKKNKDDVSEFFEVLRRASEGTVLWPASTWFSFDAERRTDEERTEIRKRSSNRAAFLPRRTFENYLMHSGALAALLTELDGGTSYSAADVEAWIGVNRDKHRKGASLRSDFLVEGDCASLLKAMFSELSETRVQYNKVEHGSRLTSWLIEHDKEFLRELIDYVVDVIRNVPQGAV